MERLVYRESKAEDARGLNRHIAHVPAREREGGGRTGNANFLVHRCLALAEESGSRQISQLSIDIELI